MRCLTSVSICPSLIRLLYLLHVFLCWINAWGPLWFWKNGRFICFLGALQSLFASQLSAEWQTHWREQSSAKNLKFVCACQPGLTTKSWDMPCFLEHATPGLTPRTCVFFFFPAAFTTLPGGKRSGCSLWFECTRGRLLQTELATLGLLNRWQSSPGCQTQWVKCFWLC